ncbi:4-diphosphocytidyl-2-C-methyl-D-erythritol kinase [Planctomycetota bacterium]|nr:4-diphosphocytidyl-2-C-methyl-D-erythritol kinase [Planctomycetota bacterium]
MPLVPASVTLAAPAKINLFLEVTGRRSDGFHGLETVFQTIELHDTVQVEVVPAEPGSDQPQNRIALSCDDPSLPVDQRNLAWRAAAAYLSLHPFGQVAITLSKRIPHGAGLGGGSSDAATVLRALALHDPAPPDLFGLAAGLGSDVPFFLLGGTAHATGRGEILAALPDLPDLPITVLMPEGASCPTPAIFAALTDDERGPRPARGADWWRAALASVTVAGFGPLLTNRLTEPAVRCCPAVGKLLEVLHKRGDTVWMTGSGAACVVLGVVEPPPATRAWPTRLRRRSRLDALN